LYTNFYKFNKESKKYTVLPWVSIKSNSTSRAKSPKPGAVNRQDLARIAGVSSPEAVKCTAESRENNPSPGAAN
jgi:hypothetical protein